jgi:hypothetical protein
MVKPEVGKFGQPVHFVLLDFRFERAAAERPMRP